MNKHLEVENMQWFRHLKTASKVNCLVAGTSLFLFLVGFAGYYSSTKIADTMDDMYKNRLLAIKCVNGARGETRRIEALTMELFVTQDNAKEQKNVKEIQEIRVSVDKLLSDYGNTKLDSFEVDKLSLLKDELKNYRIERKIAQDLALAGKKQEAYTYFENKAEKSIDNVNVLLNELAEYNAKVAEADKIESEKLVSFTNKLIVSTTIVAIILALVAGWLIAKMIANPLVLLVSKVREIAQGNLAVEKTEVNSKDEVGQLAQEFNTMTTNLYHLVKHVSQTAEQLAASSEELTAGAEQSAQASNQVAITITEVAQGAEKQAKAVDITAAAVGAISANIQQIAANTSEIAGMTDKTTNAAQVGVKAVDDAVAQMGSIEKTVSHSAKVVANLGERSKEIGEIVGTISGIASQTNLLALNAAIEAARAGEQGRGFAVVAEEVRKLAEQSQEAAKHIADLISHIQNETSEAVKAMDEGTREVKGGTEVVNTAGQSFKEIVSLIDVVSKQVKETSSAIQQVALGSQEIVTSVSDIEKVSKEAAGQTQTVSAATEEQSASMEEIASSSQALAKMAEELQTAIEKFKT